MSNDVWTLGCCLREPSDNFRNCCLTLKRGKAFERTAGGELAVPASGVDTARNQEFVLCCSRWSPLHSRGHSTLSQPHSYPECLALEVFQIHDLSFSWFTYNYETC